MKSVLEIHILQNFAPSNLNRDDTGSPKDAVFGGVRRARISSQSLKRSMRQYFKAQRLLKPDELAVRTKRLSRELTDQLVALGHAEAAASKAAANAIQTMGSQKQMKLDSEGKTEYLVFLGVGEIEKLANVIDLNFQALAVDKFKAEKLLKDALENCLALAPRGGASGRGGDAVDVALFGRMIANLPERNADAAAQVAHALGTGKAEREFDFYTAVDDLKPDDTAGADMLGTVEFVSATYYRYANLDLEQLRANLQGDTGLLLRGVEAFLRASIYAAPSGKQNTFAAHNLPSFVGFTVRQDASPRNLANAFETPVQGAKLVEQSLRALGREWEKQERIYGQPGHTVYLNSHDERDVTWTGKADDASAVSGELPGQRVSGVDQLISSTMREVRSALGLADAAD
jgi:CRISPR system Cascade subunit CasC